MRSTFLSSLGVFAALCSNVFADDSPRFNRDVRPILSNNCLPCHGPDTNKRKADLRLDQRESALAKHAIVPGDLAASEILRRISTTDPDELMPPPASELHLSTDQIDTLRRWVAAGAEYQPHWALVPPPDLVAPPAATESDPWVRSPVDAFVLERLHEEGLAPSPPADKATLLRRASFDLTGLPPTLAELDAFDADPAPDAFARAIDRLLASPAYGERMALDWLDVARYADTFGYQSDVEMDVWPWRDWVIDAFNRNLPYDIFLTWQLAGDLLDHPTQEQRLATTFNRLHRQTNEGGSINEEFRVASVSDRTETFSTAILGLTMGCAKCHDHKFDPISQRDYFSMFSFFANIDESGLYSHFTHTAPTPSLLLYKDSEADRHAALKADIARLEASLAAAEVDSDVTTRADAWIADPARAVSAAKPVVDWPFETAADGKTPDRAAPERDAKLTLAPSPAPGVNGQALAFMGDNGVESAGAADFERSSPFTLSLWIKVQAHADKAVVLHRTKAETDAASRGFELLLDHGKPLFGLNHFWPGNAIRIIAKDPVPLNTWTHLAAVYDGSSRASGLAIYVDGTFVAVDVVRDKLFKTIRYEGDKALPLTLAQRFRDAGLKGAVDELRVYDVALCPLEISALATQQDIDTVLAERIATGDNAALRTYYLQRVDPALNAARTQLGEARRAEAEFVETVRNIMAMEETPQPRQSYILTRGEYDKRGDPVSPDTPHALPPFPADQPRNRLGLARWLTAPGHPLTARVAVNRYWQIFFGRGLVETQEDFGSQGKLPTHPELLDYLARTFINSGWDVKALCRSIVLSATYQQSSSIGEDLRSRDPYNTLLARGPSFRLSAEQIRDNALAASGLLTPTIGGPSVKPYQPAGLWEDASSQGYTPDKGAALYRRGMYTFIKRTVPPPATLTFDAGSREVCTVRRERTMTPLQALVLLNDPQYVEAARVLAERVLAGDPARPAPEHIDTIFRTLLGRVPSSPEREVLKQAYEEQRAWFATRKDEAVRYAKTGETPPNETLDPIEVAAATAVAQAVMNLNEFQVLR